MQTIKILLLTILFEIVAFAQAPVVSNVTFEQRTDGSLIVDVYYDVEDINVMNISLSASDDGGSTWDLNCTNVTGDVGSGITRGTDKHIVWDFYADNPGLSGSNFKVRVTAEDYLETGTVTDIDGNIYQTVKIGDQWWMAENLKVTHFGNGDIIPNVTNNTSWVELKSGAYCFYNNDNNNNDYGALYNWSALNDARGIAPDGWHVASDEDWKELEMFLGLSQEEASDASVRGTDEGGKLKEIGFVHWNDPNTGATNESGFTALPGGCRLYSNGEFSQIGNFAYFWTITELNSTVAWIRILHFEYSAIRRDYFNKLYGLSVRCVKGESTLPSMTSISISPQDTTLFNSESCNFSCTAHYSDGSSIIINNNISWSITSGTAGNIDYNGLFTSSSTDTGNVAIAASYQGQTAQATVTVISMKGETGTVTDIDGNVYQTVKIGDQWWMAENLKVTHFRNGEEIPYVTGNSDWTNLSTGAYCFYDNDSDNAIDYGALYNWYTVNDSRDIAPEDWHIPSDEEWSTLINYLRGSGIAGGKMKETGTIYWNSPNTGATNESGFSARGGGYRYSSDGDFNAMNFHAYFWSTTKYNNSSAWTRRLGCEYGIVYSEDLPNQYGISVRCIKD